MVKPNDYELEQGPIIDITFENTDARFGTVGPFDPSVVTVEVTDPVVHNADGSQTAGAVTVYTYGTSPELTRGGVGAYLFSFQTRLFTLRGLYKYVSKGRGTMNATTHGEFYVE